MPANTTHGLPYPVGTDRVMDGDNAIQNLAQAVDTKLLDMFIQGGYLAAVSSTAASWTGTITFPIAFLAVPVAIVMTGATNAASVVWMATGATASGFTFYAQWNDMGSHSNSGPAMWMALGKRPANA